LRDGRKYAMKILVAYASKHGATQAIAERIAEKLGAAGHGAEARPVKAAGDLAGYDAFVIGSAAYIGHWQKKAAELVRRNRAVLAGRPGRRGCAARGGGAKGDRRAPRSHPPPRPPRLLRCARPGH